MKEPILQMITKSQSVCQMGHHEDRGVQKHMRKNKIRSKFQEVQSKLHFDLLQFGTAEPLSWAFFVLFSSFVSFIKICCRAGRFSTLEDDVDVAQFYLMPTLINCTDKIIRGYLQESPIVSWLLPMFSWTCSVIQTQTLSLEDGDRIHLSNPCTRELLTLLSSSETYIVCSYLWRLLAFVTFQFSLVLSCFRRILVISRPPAIHTRNRHRVRNIKMNMWLKLKYFLTYAFVTLYLCNTLTRLPLERRFSDCRGN